MYTVCRNMIQKYVKICRYIYKYVIHMQHNMYRNLCINRHTYATLYIHPLLQKQNLSLSPPSLSLCARVHACMRAYVRVHATITDHFLHMT